MTLGLPPAGIFWQPAGGSPSPNSLPSPLRSFVPRSCSAHLGAVRESEARREGTGGPASAPSRPPRPPPAPPLLRPSPAPSSRGGRHRAPRPRRLTPRPRAAVTRPSWGRPSPETRSLLPTARTPPASPARRRRHQPSAPSFYFRPFFPGLARVRLVRKLQQMEKRPSPPPPPPPQGRKGSPFVFDSCPNSTVPALAAGEDSGCWFKGRGSVGKVFGTRTNFFQNARLPLTRGRGAAHPSPPGALPPQQQWGAGGEDETQTPRAKVCFPRLKLRVPDWMARQFRNLTCCGQTLVILTCSLKVSAWGRPGRAPAPPRLSLTSAPPDPGSCAAFMGRGLPPRGRSSVSVNRVYF